MFDARHLLNIWVTFYLLEKLNVQVSEWRNCNCQLLTQIYLLKCGAIRREVSCMKFFRLSNFSRI